MSARGDLEDEPPRTTVRDRSVGWEGFVDGGSTYENIAALCGILSVVIALGAIFGASVLSVDFTWSHHALSDLGAPGAPTAPVFNYGLILAGLFGLVFAGGLVVSSTHLLTRIGAITLVGSVAFLVLVGVFPIGHRYHLVVAVLFYVLFTYAMWLYGTGHVLAGRTTFGIGTMWIGIVHVTYWLLWGVGVRIGPGLAVPELVGAGLFSAWVCYVAVQILTR